VTVAPQLAVGTTLVNADDVWFSVFQSITQPNATVLLAGNFFLGLQAYTAVRIDMGSLLGLARGATIETGLTNAAVTFTAAGNWTAGGTITCTVVADTGPRGLSELVPNGDTAAQQYDSRLAFKPDGGYGPAWRRDFSGVFDMRAEDTGGTPFVDTGVATTGSFGIRTVANLREQFAHPFTVSGGPWSIARMRLRLRRFGNPIGSCEVAIQTDTSDGFGHVQPDGVDLGVTATVLNSVAPLSPGIGLVDYAFAPDLVLPDGNYWAVLRPVVTYPVSLTDFIVWGQRRVFLGPGGSHRTLLGNRFGHGNYPGHADVHLDLAAKELGPAIVWNPVARSTGQVVSTPDLSPLVQEVVRLAGHETIHALIFVFRTSGETRTYRFAGNAHATFNPPGFACQFRRRDTRGGVQ
jgi:hypothetical protein